MKVKTILLTVMAALLLYGCKPEEPQPIVEAPTPTDVTESEVALNMPEEELKITNTVLDKFKQIAQIPRSSRNEGEICKYICDWAQKQGFSVNLDDYNNIIFDVPATQELEKLPLTVIHAHLDMKCEYDEKSDFDPKTNGITPIQDNESGTLTADGTSLGADNGIGVALAMAISEGEMPHGPLRVIFTSSREEDMQGAMELAGYYLQDPVYVLDLDGISSDTAVVSSVGGQCIKTDGKISTQLVQKPNFTLVEFTADTTDINNLSPVNATGVFLQKLKDEEIEFELMNVNVSGSDMPLNASCQIATDDKEKIHDVLSALREEYTGFPATAVSDTDPEKYALQDSDVDNLIKFLTESKNGVLSQNENIPETPETTAYLTSIELTSSRITTTSLVQSFDNQQLADYAAQEVLLAEKCGYSTENIRISDVWKYDPKSKLLGITQKAYNALYDKDINLSFAHKGYECATFLKKNPSLDVICLGVDISDPGTTKETLDIYSIPKVWELIREVLENL